MAATMRRRTVASAAAADKDRGDNEIVKTIKTLDVYPKTLPEFNEKTSAGGLISVCAVSLISALVVAEVVAFFQTVTTDHLSVDTERESQIRINLNITFPALPCSGVGLVTMDVAGEQQVDVVRNLVKTRLDADGLHLGEVVHTAVNLADRGMLRTDRPDCGKCYSDEGLQRQFVSAVEREVKEARQHGRPMPPGFAAQCCNSCDDVRAAVQRVRLVRAGDKKVNAADWKSHPLCAHDAELIDPGALEQIKEGCNVVNKVAGNFHVAPGRAFSSQGGHLVHEFKPFQMHRFNASHVIHRLSFGPHYPSQVNPLDSAVKQCDVGSALFQYYIKVVPTTYVALGGKSLATSQYSVTEAMRPILPDPQGRGPGAGSEFVLPGVFFIYDISPVKVTYTEARASFWGVLVSLCAIVGGVFVVAGMVDSAIYSVSQTNELAM